MPKMRSSQTLLWFEIAAFGLIIAMSWVSEVFGVSARLLGGQHRPDLGEASIETIVILLVAIPLIVHTRRVVTRPFYFEGFLRVCAWCKNVESHGDWIPVSEFFQERFDTATSHGMCPACFARQVHVGGAA
jgi:hypothetical protein